MPTQLTRQQQLDNARFVVLMSLYGANKLTDQFLPQPEMDLFVTKTFPEWPKEMQDKLRPYGAQMIQDET